MDVYRCNPASGPINATVELPGSKSITNRALVAAAFADGNSLLSNALIAEDTELMISALRSLGIAITVDAHACVVEVTGGGGVPPACDAELWCGNAGTAARFLTAVVSTGQGQFELDGDSRMRERPLGELLDVLRSLGAGVECIAGEGHLPIRVHARGLRGGHVAFDTPASSQFVSALLLASPYAQGDVLIDVEGPPTSRPYMSMTTAVMDAFGVVVLQQFETDGAKFVVAAPQRYKGRTYAIEPDASNATYFLAAGALTGGSVTVMGLGTASLQGDCEFAAVLARMGCRVERTPDCIKVSAPPSGHRLKGIDVDLNAMPDTVQTLAVVALFAEGPTVIRNVGNLRVKETDRLSALRTELTKLGATVEERSDGLTISPPQRITPATIDTYLDHRMAMSFALAGLMCAGITIKDPRCCSKTMPDFFQRWERMVARTG